MTCSWRQLGVRFRLPRLPPCLQHAQAGTTAICSTVTMRCEGLKAAPARRTH